MLQRVNNGTGSPTDVTINGGQTSTTKYYSAGGKTVAIHKDGVLSYLLPDTLGSVSVTLYADGSTESVQLYAPYGATRYSDGSTSTAYSFTGQRADAQTGLMDYGARYYDPVSGRFISADGVGNNATGDDPFAYAADNPETMTDPTGNASVDQNGDTSRNNPNGSVTYTNASTGKSTTTPRGGSNSSSSSSSSSGPGYCNSYACYDGNGNFLFYKNGGGGGSPSGSSGSGGSTSSSPSTSSSHTGNTSSSHTGHTSYSPQKIKSIKAGMKQGDKTWQGIAGLITDSLSIVQDGADVASDIFTKDWGALGADILSGLVHIGQIIKDFVVLTGGVVPQWVLTTLAVFQTVASIWNTLKSVVENVLFFVGGGLTEALNNMAQTGVKAVIGLIKGNALSVVTSVAGLASTSIDWSQVSDAQIDNETPAQITQWCQVHNASYC